MARFLVTLGLVLFLCIVASFVSVTFGFVFIIFKNFTHCFKNKNILHYITICLIAAFYLKHFNHLQFGLLARSFLSEETESE